jgi:hypothetical protein
VESNCGRTVREFVHVAMGLRTCPDQLAPSRGFLSPAPPLRLLRAESPMQASRGP